MGSSGRVIGRLGLCLLIALAGAAKLAGHETAQGVVFHDVNGNGQQDHGEQGLGGVRVSNGLDFVASDPQGRYSISVDDDTIVFVVKPRGWQTPLNEKNLLQFYYIHKPAGSPDDEFKYKGVEPTGRLPASVDFPLTPAPEPAEFSVIVMGDPQPRTREEVRFYANDVVAELVDTDALFGISMGDIVGDDLSLFEHVNNVQATAGIPWYAVYGNHDLNFRSPDDKHADETFERVYGPANYMFQYGSVHFIVLDNVWWNGFRPGAEEPAERAKQRSAARAEEGTQQKDAERNQRTGNKNPKAGTYEGRFSDRQLRFVANYVAGVPAEERIIVCTHIPLVDSDSLHMGTQNWRELVKLLAAHPHQMSLSAHTHYQQHDFLAVTLSQRQPPTGRLPGHSEPDAVRRQNSPESSSPTEVTAHQEPAAGRPAASQSHAHPHSHPHHVTHPHHTVATGSGSWYGGPLDEQGFPMTPMRDGVPNGYVVATFWGTEYRLRYKAARMPAEFQMSIHTPQVISAEDTASAEVLVNVFNGSERSQVRMRVREQSQWQPMTRSPRESPTLRALFELSKKYAKVDGRRPLSGPIVTPHMWKAQLPARLPPGVHVLEVESNDMFGQVDRAVRLIEVE